MNFILTDDRPIAATPDGRFIVQAGVHQFSLRDGVPHEFHYVATSSGHRNEWLRAKRRMGNQGKDFLVFDLRHVMPELATALRGNLERDVPGVITFTARGCWQRAHDLYVEIADHVIARASLLDATERAAHA